ncbi:Imm8 family immunity protein [Nonomuraea lactucae]|uniref:Imm8 family immunity protein n=1 Tax=Nonomuraea lactucae TaxID=2249762 RepID=UPI000DE31AA3|nr:Imm8 family immunity protein [Nonomuraea lactucae]
MRVRVGEFRWVDLEAGRRIDDPANACELLEMHIRPQGELGEERFQLTVCTPSALTEQLRHRPFLIGRHWLFVAELHPDKVTEWLSDRISVLAIQHCWEPPWEPPSRTIVNSGELLRTV